jgi:hypothetical protein
MSVNDFKKYITNVDNGYLNIQTANQINFSVLYSPPQFEALKRLDNYQISKNNVDSIVGYLDDQMIFYFKMKDEGSKDLLKRNIIENEAYDQRLLYLIGSIKKDFKIINLQDTIQCSLHHYEKGYGINPNVVLTLVFQKPTGNIDGFTFIYDDKLFKSGPVKFNFPGRLINKKFDIAYL